MAQQNMLKEALSLLKGPFGQFWEDLSGDEGEIWLKEFKRFLRKENCWEETKGVSSLFYFIGSITLPATTKDFVVREKFVIDTKKNARVKISSLGEDFCRYFLNKVEKAQPERTLYRHGLLKQTLDRKIIAEFHGKVETSLQDIWYMMGEWPGGERFLDGDRAHMFYARGTNDRVMVIRAVIQPDNGYDIDAYDLNHYIGATGPIPWAPNRFQFYFRQLSKPRRQ